MQIRAVVTSVVAPLAVIAAVGVGATWASHSSPHEGSPLAAALGALPDDTLVTGFTNWSDIRAALGVGDDPAASDLGALSDDAALRDLSTRSVLGQSIEVMNAALGWSAADLEWETYGQSAEGAVMVARLGSRVSPDEVVASLTKLGYRETRGVWTAPDDFAARVDPGLVDTLGAVAVDSDRGLIVASNSIRSDYVHAVLGVVNGSAKSLLDVRPAVDVANGLAGATSALIESGRFSCDTASLSALDQTVRDQAKAALARSGALAAVEFGGRGVVDDGGPTQQVRFSMAFADPTTAAGQATVRRELARGPFIGRSGQVEDTLQLRDVAVSGSALTMTFDHPPDSTAFMVGKGPLLFASCPTS